MDKDLINKEMKAWIENSKLNIDAYTLANKEIVGREVELSDNYQLGAW